MYQILYHATPSKNVEPILANGLLRNHGTEKHAFICLSQEPDSWMRDGLKLLDVDITGLKCRISCWLKEGLDEVCVWDDIPPSRIRVHETNSVKN